MALPPAPAPVLWGDMKPVVSVKELMRDMIDPIADNIFDSVAIIVDKNGTKEYLPKTDEDWENTPAETREAIERSANIGERSATSRRTEGATRLHTRRCTRAALPAQRPTGERR